MTRINLVSPKELIRQHLIAEYYELPRVFKLARQCDNAPEKYKMGKGHVCFFYDKIIFLTFRYKALIKEMKRRGYSPDPQKYNKIIAFAESLPEKLQNNYSPTYKEIAISRERLQEKIKQKQL